MCYTGNAQAYKAHIISTIVDDNYRDYVQDRL